MKTIHIVEDSLPLAWEKAVVECWKVGDSFPTQYDKPNDPNSRDVTAMIHIKRPMLQPRIHRGFPGGLNDLEKYRSEVLYGVHNYWMEDLTNPNRWEYTYNERLFEYKVSKEVNQAAGYQWVNHENLVINQIDKCIDMLKKCGHTRRAQAITWQPWNDLGISDPTCLQRLWFRVQDGKLNMNIHIRSNCAYKAAFMNMYAFVELQAWIASQVGVDVGEYCHIADSFHIYGSYFKDFEGFLNMVNTRSFEDRTFSDDFAKDFFIEGCDELLAEPNMPEKCREKVINRKNYLEGK